MKNKVVIFLVLLFLAFTGFGAQVTYAAEPQITIYVVPAITDAIILPTSSISSSYISNSISITASPGEYEPASFVLRSSGAALTVLPIANDLTGPATIPAANISIRAVGVWYQAGEWLFAWEPGWGKTLTPELLLNDASLVQVLGTDNYLKLTNGSQLMISSPDGIAGIPPNPLNTEFPVADSATLQPVAIPADTNRQFWVTVRTPEDAPPGTYTGTIDLMSGSENVGQIQVTLSVLPVRLTEPRLTYGLYYLGIPSVAGRISYEEKNTTQFRAELWDMAHHGTMPTTCCSIGQLPNVLSAMVESGLSGGPLFYLGLWHGDNSFDLANVPTVITMATNYGFTDVYFQIWDEPGSSEIDAVRARAGAVHAAGGKVWAALSLSIGGGDIPTAKARMSSLADVLDIGLLSTGHPVWLGQNVYDPALAKAYHDYGHKVLCYNAPQTGVEKPLSYRIMYGLLMWQKDYDGTLNFAYQFNPAWGHGNLWDDFIPETLGQPQRRRSHIFAYPTTNGVVGTIEWEGWREGIDDIRLSQRTGQFGGFATLASLR